MPIEEVSVPDEDREVRVKRFAPASYPNAKKVFRLFGDYPLFWNVQTPFLRVAEELFLDKGIEELSELMAWYKKNRKRDFCPQFDDPLELAKKYASISRFFDKINL